jgi:hypothetical protein
MREVYIFDIDGCVMVPIFANFNNDETREKIVVDAIQNGDGIKLYPDFIKYYKINCIPAESIYFITGRKKSEFGDLTDKQLQPLLKLKKFEVIYYPESKPHKIQDYFDWKVKEIKEIIKRLPKEHLIFHIFDDMNDYFSKLREFAEKWEINLHFILIEDEISWNQLLQ